MGRSPFQIVYRIHPRGIHELRDLQTTKKRSAYGGEFANAMRDLDEEVNKKLQGNNIKYEVRVDLR